MFYAVELDENNYFNGKVITSNNKEFLKNNGILVDNLPDNPDQDLWLAYKLVNNKWVLDNEVLIELQNKKNKELEVEEINLQLNEIKEELNKLDIKTMKYVDGSITSEEYEIYRKQKESLRSKYNELERKLD